jgi:uncharacterized protein (DUF433 family)
MLSQHRRRTVADAINWRDHVEIRPEVLVGKPVIKGTRLAVELMLDLLAAGCTEAQILDNYPGLTREQLQACVAYAADVIRSERVLPLVG